MARSWEPSVLTEPAPSDETPFQRLITWLSQFLSDLPLLSRHVGHLTLLLLLLVVIENVIPSHWQAPTWRNLTSMPSPQVATPEATARNWTNIEENTRYLEMNAVPLTMRVMREILPFAPPQRTMRTTVLTYRVQSGDTVLGIAEKFGLSGNSLLWANERLDENPDFLHVGQELNILPVDGVYHTVAKDETLEKIASKYKVDPPAITGYGGNGLTPPYTVQAGQKLIVPGGVKPYVPRVVTGYYEGTIPQGAKKGSGAFVWPMSGVITQRPWSGHMAIDIGAPIGTPIAAADAGFVAIVQYSNVGYGRMVVIDHGNDFQTRYAHMNAIYVEAGQSVARGQALGTCGITGRTTGPHLHFEVMRNGVLLNPLNYLP